MIYRITGHKKHLNAIYARIAPLAGIYECYEDIPCRLRREYTAQIKAANVLTDGIRDLWHEMPVPERPINSNPEARFWFTEAGWKRFGLPYLCALRRAGVSPQVLCQKNPKRSTIYYRDEWQILLLS